MCNRTPLPLIAVLAVLGLSSHVSAQMDFEPHPVPLAPEGEFSAKNPPPGYSHVAQLTWHEIGDDDVKQAPKVAARYAQMFGAVVLADVRPDPDKPGHYKLNRVAVGQTVRQHGKPWVVNSKSSSVSFIASQVLATGEQELARVTQIARYDTAVLFDVPAMINVKGKHQELTMRYFVWTNSTQGGLATLNWIVDPSAPDGEKVLDSEFVQLPNGFEQTRMLSVDHAQFNILGVPSKAAFAVNGLPEAPLHKMSPELVRLASLPRFNKESLQQLAMGLSQSLASQQTVSKAD
ncbi:MAG: hypothetical protein KDA37_02470 [Planctomycetales bacterium]|nr:hypothetical protein [Planctomycetales bacterium]